MANEFVIKNGLIVSGSTRVSGGVTAQSFTGSFTGSIAFATSASYAVTASYALNAADSVWTGSAGNIYYNGGNVGIGTTSIGAKLEINSSAVLPIIRARYNGSYYTDYDSNGIDFRGSSQTFDIKDNGTVAIRIASGGNVGIGTTSPTEKLHVDGRIMAAGSGYTLNPTAPIFGQYSSTRGYVQVPSNGQFEIWTGGTSEIATFYNNQNVAFFGNVGIGTTAPATKFHVHGYTTIDSVDVVATFSSDNTAKRVNIGYSTSGDYGFINAVHTGVAWKNLIFGVNGGSIGIGTTNPSSRLAILNSGASDSIITEYRMTNGNNAATFRTDDNVIFGIHAQNSGDIYIKDTSDNVLFYGKNGGNVGIGTTSPSYKLQVSGAGNASGVLAGFTGTGPSGSISIGHSGNGGSIGYANVGATSNLFYVTTGAGTIGSGFAMDNNGNVGIGTTSPGQKLSVVGSGNTYIQVNNGSNSVYFGKISGAGTIQSDDDITFRPALTELMRLTGTNVGIGVSTPAAKLQVSGSTNVLNVRGSGSVTTSSIFSVDGNNGRLFEVSDDLSNSLFSVNTIAGLPVIEAFADYSVTMGTYGQYVLQVTGSNVGIGSSAPGAKLDVNGNVRATSFTGSISGSATNAVSASYALTASYALNAGDSIWTGSAGNIYYNGGNVGIGTATPVRKLHVNGDAQIDTNLVVISGIYNTNYYAGGATATYFKNTVGTDTLTILQSGNVGIGNTSPVGKLHIAATSGVASPGSIALAIRDSGSPTFGFDFNLEGVSTGDLSLMRVVSGVQSQVMTFDRASGNVGIGTTSPATALQVNGTARATRLNSTGGIVDFDAQTGNNFIQIASSIVSIANGGNVNMTITSAGNVGIGTTSPAAKLDIVGDAVIRNGYNMVIGDTIANPVASTSKAALTLRKFTSGNASTVVSASYYLGVGGNEYTIGSYRLIGFGYAETSATTTYPAYIGYRETSTSGYTLGDLIFGTRATTGASDDPSERMRITSGGNVGIGTTNPSYKLDVVGEARFGSNYKAIVGDDGTYSGYATIGFGGTTNGYNRVFGAIGTSDGLFLCSATGRDIIFRPNGGTTDVFTVGSNGSLYSNSYLFAYEDISYNRLYRPNGTVGVYLGGTGDPGNYYDNTNHNFRNAGGGTTYAVINSSGNVGIGTTSPQERLDVNTNSTGLNVDNTAAIFGNDVGTNQSRDTWIKLRASVATTDLTWAFGTNQSGDFRFNYLGTRATAPTSGTTLVTIKNSGNVGIGITTPTGRLDIVPASQNAINISRAGGYASLYSSNDLVFETDGVFYFGVYTPRLFSVNSSFYTTAAGNVGIGTTNPGEKLVVHGNGARIKIQTASDPASYFTYLESNYDATNTFNIVDGGTYRFGAKALVTYNDTYINGYYNVYIATGTSTNSSASNIRLFVAQNGSIGIGTTSPRETLQITGNTVIGSAGLNSYKTNLYLTYNAGSDETWVRIYVPQDYNSSNNGGTIRVRVLWEGDHATFGAYQDYQISYKTFYPSSPYLKFSNVLCTNKTSDFATGATYYPPTSTPDVLFYDNSDGYLYVKVKGTHTAYNTARYIEAEIFGRTTAQPTIATTSAPGAPVELTKTIQFLPQEGNIYASGNVGIGTTNPITTLEVIGNVKATSFTGSFSGSITHAVSASYALTASYALNAGDSIWTGSAGNIYYSGGNVGIGTASPTGKLTISQNNSGGVAALTFTEDESTIQGPSANTKILMGSNLSLNAASTWIAGTNGSERMRITSGGNVGIGSTAPAYTLDVAGNARFINSGVTDVYVGGALMLKEDGTGNVKFGGVSGGSSASVYGAGSEYIRLSGGNVGIGTTSPSVKLDVSGTVLTTTTLNSAAGSYTIDHPGINTWKIGITSTNSSTFHIGNDTGGSFVNKILNITQAGNVGIGTITPSSRLDIYTPSDLGSGANGIRVQRPGAYGQYGYLEYLISSDVTVLGSLYTGGGGSAFGQTYFRQHSSTTSRDAMVINSSGNVGIGTVSPGGKLEINTTAATGATALILRTSDSGGNSAIRWQNSAGTNQAGIGSNFNVSDSGALEFINNTTTNMILRSNGNVGIGTTSPSTTLDVLGKIKLGLDGTYGGSDYVAIGFGGISNGYNRVFGYNGTSDGLYLASATGRGIYFRVNGGSTDNMVITSGGNVGIGSTAPAFTLDVNGNVAIATKLSVGTTYNGFAANIAGVVYVIGASVWVNDGSGYTNASSPGTGFLPYSDGTLVFNSVNSEKMRISASGLVGIGTNNPLFPLDVIGTIRATTVIETSARKYKTNIQNLEPQLNKVLQLQPVTFDWKEKKGERPSIGLIADDVINIYPEFVVKNKENEIEGIDYSKLTAVLIQSVKELKEIIDRQQEQINALLTK